MKKKFLFLPLLMLVLASCGPSGDTSSDTSSNPSSDTSSGGEEDKQEINPAELNAAAGFDVYSLLPKIYSNDYDVFDESSDDYPVDIYVDLFDWELADAEAYELALSTSLQPDEQNVYIIQDNLYVFIYLDNELYAPDEVFGLNIYSMVEPEVSDVWPAQAINDFFGSSEIGGLVPSFDSDADFSYYVSGEGEEAQLIVYTDYATIDAEDTYIAALEAALWVIDDSLYDYFGYVANDPEEQISLIFYWSDGVMYWSFMTFYHEEESVGVSVIIDDAIPEGWTYISNNPQQYPNPSFLFIWLIKNELRWHWNRVSCI